MKAKGDIEILLADDERAFRSGMKALLESEGFAVRTARDGEAAVRKFAERVPDVVILDVMMPRMNGFRACEEIRKTDRRVPVVFLTAKDGEVDQVRALGLGADDYVSKSAPEALLVARIRRAVERSRELVAGRAADADGCLHLGQTVVDMTSLEVSVGGEVLNRIILKSFKRVCIQHNRVCIRYYVLFSTCIRFYRIIITTASSHEHTTPCHQ